MYSRMSFTLEANSMQADQTAPLVWSGFILFAIYATKMQETKSTSFGGKVCLFDLVLYISANSYGHDETS